MAQPDQQDVPRKAAKRLGIYILLAFAVAVIAVFVAVRHDGGGNTTGIEQVER